MKRVIIGGFILLCGAIINAGILIAAGVYSSTLTGWSGASRFWYAIYGSSTMCMKLGFLFRFSYVLLLVGLLILGVELFSKEPNVEQ